MAPPWVKSQGAPVAMVSSTPWANGPGRVVAQQSSNALPTAMPTATAPAPSMTTQQQRSNPPRSPVSPGLNAGQGQPKSLGALLQHAPLRALTPSINEASDNTPTATSTAPSSGGKPPQLLKGPIAPQPQGPLAGAKFVLPPLPPPMRLKPVGGSGNPVRLAKIAKLRQSVNPHPEDIKPLLREIESGIKLNHGACNDRSIPLKGPCQTFYPNF